MVVLGRFSLKSSPPFLTWSFPTLAATWYPGQLLFDFLTIFEGGGGIRENSFPNFIHATIEHFKTNWWILWNSPFFFIKGHNLKGFFADLLDFLVASGEEEQRKCYMFCYRNSGIFYSVPVKFIWKLKTFFYDLTHTVMFLLILNDTGTTVSETTCLSKCGTFTWSPSPSKPLQ